MQLLLEVYARRADIVLETALHTHIHILFNTLGIYSHITHAQFVREFVFPRLEIAYQQSPAPRPQSPPLVWEQPINTYHSMKNAHTTTPPPFHNPPSTLPPIRSGHQENRTNTRELIGGAGMVYAGPPTKRSRSSFSLIVNCCDSI